MSYKKEQFIEDFKNAYNQTQQLHYLYKYLKEYEGQIASVNVEKLEEETDNVAYYQFSFTLDNGNVIETNSIAFASYTFVNELDNRVISINNTITSLDRRISNNEGDIVNINDKMLTLPDTAPSTRKVVTIDTNGAQDNVDYTQLPTLMSNIVDSHGNSRFVEGDITMNTFEGVTQTYGKWSLSGTHLMIVLVFTADANTELPSNRSLARIPLPQFILDKIKPLDKGEYVDTKLFNMRGKDNWWQATYNLNILINKASNYVFLSTTSVIPTITNDCTVRIQFDLIIDSE